MQTQWTRKDKQDENNGKRVQQAGNGAESAPGRSSMSARRNDLTQREKVQQRRGRIGLSQDAMEILKTREGRETALPSTNFPLLVGVPGLQRMS